MRISIFIIFILVCSGNTLTKNLNFKVLNSFKHDNKLFTQGLEFDGSYLLESAGKYAASKLVKYNVYAANKPIVQVSLPPKFFAEGITIFNNVIYMLTWRENTLLRYDLNSFKEIKPRLDYLGEGWGLAYYLGNFYRSDGSNKIWRHNIDNFKVNKVIKISKNGKPVRYLNELEIVHWNKKTFILANQLLTNFIHFIDINTGNIVHTLDITALKNQQSVGAGQTNGIAWQPHTKTLFITGKYWDKIYQIKVLADGR